MVHSGKVWAVQFGPRPTIRTATFFTEFRVDENFCYLVDERKVKLKILQFARAKYEKKKLINNKINTEYKDTGQG